MQASIKPYHALELLQAGNKRFVENLKINRNLLQQVNETSSGQYPFATILSCIDSRTSPELIFDQGLGDIFSIRIAGNVVNEDILGSMEFACKIAGSKIIVVLGHTKCGAVTGACNQIEMGNLTCLLNKIQPSVKEASDKIDFRLENTAFVEKVTLLNVKNTVQIIKDKSIIIADMLENDQIAIIGGLHDISTGRVDFLDETYLHKH